MNEAPNFCFDFIKLFNLMEIQCLKIKTGSNLTIFHITFRFGVCIAPKYSISAKPMFFRFILHCISFYSK